MRLLLWALSVGLSEALVPRDGDGAGTVREAVGLQQQSVGRKLTGRFLHITGMFL
jgi:hypothetical protein